MRKGVAMILLLAAVVFAVRQYIETKIAQRPASGDGSGLPPGEPGDYFPHTPGTEWIYQISTGPAEPLEFRDLAWPLSNRTIGYAARGLFRGAVSDGGSGAFVLKMKVLRRIAAQGPLRYPEGVEIAIETDGLGVFNNSDHVFWAITQSGRFIADEVVTYPPGSPDAPAEGGPWGTWGEQDGYLVRPVFFGSSPGTTIELGDDPQDTLTFKGVEFYDGIPSLHFCREVRTSQPEPGVPRGPDVDYLNKAFTEDTWFGRGKGLVRLEQRVAGKTSMVWTLSQFSPGQ